jgi:hypothetical protein
MSALDNTIAPHGCTLAGAPQQQAMTIALLAKPPSWGGSCVQRSQKSPCSIIRSIGPRICTAHGDDKHHANVSLPSAQQPHPAHEHTSSRPDRQLAQMPATRHVLSGFTNVSGRQPDELCRHAQLQSFCKHITCMCFRKADTLPLPHLGMRNCNRKQAHSIKKADRHSNATLTL